jgi:hypothetical protein
VLNVLHTRLRHRSSNLNADLFRVNLINDCGWVIEDAIHFFLECCLYVEAREHLKLYNILSYNSTELSYSWGEINNGENVHKRK